MIYDGNEFILTSVQHSFIKLRQMAPHRAAVRIGKYNKLYTQFTEVYYLHRTLYIIYQLQCSSSRVSNDNVDNI